MNNLDKYDYKILKALAKNSRVSLTKLAKTIQLSKENIFYRINRLKKIGVLKSTYSILNVEFMGFKQSALFMQFIRLTKNKEKEIIEYLIRSKNISWIGIIAGKWSIIVDIYSKDENELSKSLHKLLENFSDYLSDYSVLSLESKEYFLNKLLKSKDDEFIEEKLSMKKIKYDEMDLNILRLLNNNSRITYAELSKKLNLTGNAIKKRINHLNANGLIKGYSVMLDTKVMGYSLYLFQLKLLKFDLESIKKLINFFRKNPQVLFYYKYSPVFWDFEVGILVKDSHETREFINELRSEFAETVKINDFYLLLEEISKYGLPEAIFE